jgi:hypothetical protein
MRIISRLAPLLLPLLAGCATSPPEHVGNICEIFRDKRGWYEDAAEARDVWGSPIPVMMAIMHQESRFRAKAKPPRRVFLGFIPGPRPSDAYGYSQAKDSTWEWYQKSTGDRGADRDDFADAITFIGWYNYQSYKRNGIPRSDTYRLYLAYHEGHGGYGRGSYRNKDWLQTVAGKVERQAQSYRQQLAGCEKELQRGRGLFGWF